MLVGVLAFEGPARLAACLESLKDTGCDYRLAIHQDGDDPEVAGVIDAFRFPIDTHYLNTKERAGVTNGLNKLLRLRHPGEDFIRVDGDIRFLTGGWLRKLSDGRKDYGLVAPLWTGNTWEEDTRDFFAGKIRPSHIETPSPPLGGVVFHPGEIVDKLGAYRNHGRFYGCQERDYTARVRGLGLKVAYVTEVLVEHPPLPPLRGARRAETEEALKVFKRRRELYERGLDLFEPLA